MPADQRLKVVLCWHMHQPEYRNLRSGEYQLPWTYLHAIKDYVDMAAHLEGHPDARAVVNFAPVLLDQIEDYAVQVRGFLENGAAIRDPLLAALVDPALPSESEPRLALIRACLRVNETRIVKRFAPYRRLAEIATWVRKHPHALRYLDDQFLADLVMWYHLGWLAESVRRTDARVRRLLERGDGYTLHERRELLTIIGELVEGVLGRYRRLGEAGRVELAMSPYAHPILPLLLDLSSARQAMPDATLPLLAAYPDGEGRARWHIERGKETFRRHFGHDPAGCWPSEGGLSDATVGLLSEYGFRWAASGENVLRNSLAKAGLGGEDENAPYQPYRVPQGETACFFRDDGLSDLIGFAYADWHADDAVANLVHNLENIAAANADSPPRVVSIIMDGENAWEHYPENGHYFLEALYARLAEHPQLDLTTFSACLDELEPASLPGLVAGSWVYGTLSTWIGDPDKNRAWDMLGEAKQAFDEVMAGDRLDASHRAQAELQLAICEGSDWFWWFGDYNPADTVSDFERLFRHHLANLYQVLGVEPPAYLTQSFTHGTGAPALGGVMRAGSPPGGAPRSGQEVQ